MKKRNVGLVLALGLALGCLGGCKGKEKIEIVDGHETINQEILINETNFPDEVFRELIKSQFDTDGNERLSREEADVRIMHLSSMGIGDLKGIECFTNLVDLLCPYNQLTELDLSKNMNVRSLVCRNNQLVKLKINGSSMESLVCSDNQLTELDLSGCERLQLLRCSNNALTELDLSRNYLEVMVEADEGVNIIWPTKAEE